LKVKTAHLRESAAGESRIEALEAELARFRDLASLGEAAAAIVHEIKNPLAAISAPLQVLRERIKDEELREILQEVIAEVQRLDAMLRRLLMLSKPWNPKKERCDLIKVVHRVFSLSRAEPAFSKVRLHWDPAEPVYAPVDAALIEQVLWNLLQNAAEAMREGGDIRVGCRDGPRGVTLRVSDNGPGMSPEVQAKLYKPFFTTKPGGSGLGLSICRKIVEAHGGSIHISSQLGRGTEAFLSLPKGDS
jgi:signal transduction histidine kinase